MVAGCEYIDALSTDGNCEGFSSGRKILACGGKLCVISGSTSKYLLPSILQDLERIMEESKGMSYRLQRHSSTMQIREYSLSQHLMILRQDEPITIRSCQRPQPSL